MKTNHYAGIDPHVVSVIERATNKLRGRFGTTEADLADIRQDLHLGVWAALEKTAPDINREAAVNRIVDNLIRDMIRHRQRGCRDWRREKVSICAPCDAPDDAFESQYETFEDTEDLVSLSRVAFGMPPSWHERRDEAADVAAVFRGLSGDLRILADALDASEGNLSEAARLLNLPRKKARVMINRLRRILEPLRDDWSSYHDNPLKINRGRTSANFSENRGANFRGA